MPVLFLCLLLFAFPAAADFGAWLQDFREQARRQGISDATLERALPGVEYIPKVIQLDQKQPEKTQSFSQYIRNTLPDARVKKGRAMLWEHQALLEKIGRKYGVQPRFIVALWGKETSYGANTGGYSLISSLATLAYEGRRREFFETELLKALRILDEGHITPEAMKGSWAGAMGQCQFMPSSFLNFAVDEDGDGRKDIWNSLPDVFASMANYLRQSGWDSEQTWGRPVMAAPSLRTRHGDKDTKKTLTQWHELGVRKSDGAPLPARELQASLIFPGREENDAFLIYDNYRVILRWNRSDYFATAVGLLSDRIAYGVQ